MGGQGGPFGGGSRAVGPTRFAPTDVSPTLCQWARAFAGRSVPKESRLGRDKYLFFNTHGSCCIDLECLRVLKPYKDCA